MYNSNDWKPSDDQSYHQGLLSLSTTIIKETILKNILSSSTLINLYFQT